MKAVQKSVLVPYEKYLRYFGKQTNEDQEESSPVDPYPKIEELPSSVTAEPLKVPSQQNVGDRKDDFNTSVEAITEKKRKLVTQVRKCPPGIPQRSNKKPMISTVKTSAKKKWISL